MFFSGTEWAAILAAVAPVIVAATGLVVVFRKPTASEETAHRSAVAVSTVTDTKDKVEVLLNTVEILQNQLSELKELRKMDAEEIEKLKSALEAERTAHTETRKKLDNAWARLESKDRQIETLKQQIADLENK